MKLPRSSKLVLLATVVAACAEGTDDGAPLGTTRATELASTEAAFYVVKRADDRAAHVERVGDLRETICADRVGRSTCEVAEIDLSRADLHAEDEVRAAASIRDGVSIVRGKLVSLTAEAPRVGRLVVSEIWMRETAAPSLQQERARSDATFLLRDVHEGCEAWLRAEPIGGGRAAHYTTLDLSTTGAPLTDDDRRALSEGRLLAHGAGVGDAFVAVSLYRRAFVVPTSGAPSEPDAPPLR